MKTHHIVESQQFTLPMLTELFSQADRMEQILRRGGTRDYAGKIMASLFYEPSTRTRFSFEAAMLRLGGSTISTERAQEFSSVMMGETLEDTIRVVNHYADVIVLRHNEVGGAQRAASVSIIPVINAGDGKGGQHPTQALLDLYTIVKEFGSIDGVRVAMTGDLASGRTVRSLAYLLGKFERVKLFFVAPSSLQIRGDILEYLTRHNVWFSLESDLSKIISEVDVIYCTRVDPVLSGNVKDFGDSGTTTGVVDASMLARLPAGSLIMHPLPRLNEIPPSIDHDPRAAYFRQTRYGLAVRMALLASALDRN